MLIAERRDRILLLTLNNPGKRNALHPSLLSAFSSSLKEIEGDAETAVVVLTGAGSSFCSGLDLLHLANLDGEGRVGYLRAFFNVFSKIYSLKQPVIAAVNGPAIAGGFDLAAASDLRLCSRDATFGQTEIIFGLTQMMYPIYKIIGLGCAKELALTGTTISADEAHRIGLVNHIYSAEELLAQALQLAALLASRPTQALFATKQLSRNLIDMDTESAMNRMLEVISDRLKSEEHQQAIQNLLTAN
jgi:enoyl-CoA hydratase/carnithine racemase